jgi:Domain of unknown function (DUF4129)
VSRFGRWVPLAAVVALLAGAMLSAAYANPTVDRVPLEASGGADVTRPPVALAPTETAAETRAPDVGVAVPSWVGWALSVLCAALILFVVGLLVWMLLRNKLTGGAGSVPLVDGAAPTPTETTRRVRAALDEGLADLDEADSDPRRVVIACWIRLEEAAAAAGTPRQVGDTSTELVERLLATSPVSGGVLAAFAALYREARFATHTVDIAMRDQARAALTQLRDELSAGVA